MYDVFLTTGGVKVVGGGSDVWVKKWIKHIAPKLETKSYLLVDRPDPNPKKNNVKNKNIKVVYRGNENKNWFEILEGARRIHILHMYYHDRDIIKKFLSKIDSIVLHVCTEQTMSAAKKLGLPSNKFHHEADKNWENSIIPHINNPIWIGVNNNTPFHKKYVHIKTIPNFYNFKNKKDLIFSNRVGYAARIESRKCPHYLEGMDASFFTSSKFLKKWEKEFGHDFSNSKVYEFNWNFIENFYSKNDWGIFHGCYKDEPFGYSIFQSLDYGNIPIIENTWDRSFDYEYRASDKESFKEMVERIRNLSEIKRSKVLNNARKTLDKKYGDPQSWVREYLKIYNR